jgi:hypothetical protein
MSVPITTRINECRHPQRGRVPRTAGRAQTRAGGNGEPSAAHAHAAGRAAGVCAAEAAAAPAAAAAAAAARRRLRVAST